MDLLRWIVYFLRNSCRLIILSRLLLSKRWSLTTFKLSDLFFNIENFLSFLCWQESWSESTRTLGLFERLINLQFLVRMRSIWKGIYPIETSLRLTIHVVRIKSRLLHFFLYLAWLNCLLPLDKIFIFTFMSNKWILTYF